MPFQVSKDASDPRRGPGGWTQPSLAATRAHLGSAAARSVPPLMPSCPRRSRADDSGALRPSPGTDPWTPVGSVRLCAHPEVRRESPSLVGRVRDRAGVGSLERVSLSGPARTRPPCRRGPEAPPLALRRGLGDVRGKLWLGARGAGVAGGAEHPLPDPSLPEHLAFRAAPAGLEDLRARSGRPGPGAPGPGAPRARREGRGLPGGARMGGARAHAPCTRAILE